jgi:hypothetical protein
MSGNRDEMPEDLRDTVPSEDQPEGMSTAEEEDDDAERGAISSAVRSVRGSVRERRARRQSSQLRKKKKQDERREKVEEFLSPLTNEIDQTRDELSALSDEFSSDADSSEQKEEAGGGLLAGILGAPQQVGDFDGDGDADRAVFFGVDNEATGNDGPDPFGSIQEFEDQQLEDPGDGPSVPNVDAQVSQPIADYQTIFDEVRDPLAEDDDR